MLMHPLLRLKEKEMEDEVISSTAASAIPAYYCSCGPFIQAIHVISISKTQVSLCFFIDGIASPCACFVFLSAADILPGGSCLSIRLQCSYGAVNILQCIISQGSIYIIQFIPFAGD